MFLVLLSNVCAININVDTEEINLDNVLVGGYAEKVIKITSDSDDFVLITPSAIGDIKDWVSFEQNTELLNKAYPMPLKVALRPPKDIAKGVYKGLVLINAINKQSEIDYGIVTSQVKMTVGLTNQEIKQIEIRNVSIRDTEEGHPVDIFVDMANDGNVESKSNVRTEIGGKLFAHEIALLPFEETEAAISINTSLKEGRHYGNVTFLLNGTFLGNFIAPFNVLKKDSLLRHGKLIFINAKEESDVGRAMDIDTYLENIGEISFYAKFKGNVYANDMLEKGIESEKVYVPAGKTVVLKSFFTPQNEGLHKITGYVLYSTTATDEKETVVNVKEKMPEIIPLRISPTGPLLLILFLIVINIIARKKILRGRK